MSEKVTVELPDELAQRARAVAAQTQRRFEDVVAEWIDRALADPPVDSLPDPQVLALCDGQMPPGEQEELSELLARQRESRLAAAERDRLEELMQIYRRGLVRKAQALRTAVARGLRPALR
jgi:hypothetical protein